MNASGENLDIDNCLQIVEQELINCLCSSNGNTNTDTVRVVVSSTGHTESVVVLDNISSDLPSDFWVSYNMELDKLLAQLEDAKKDEDFPSEAESNLSALATTLDCPPLPSPPHFGHSLCAEGEGSDTADDVSISYSDTGAELEQLQLRAQGSFVCPCCPEQLLQRVAHFNDIPPAPSPPGTGVVVYWCSMALRAWDNAALDLAVWMCRHHGWNLNIVVVMPAQLLVDSKTESNVDSEMVSESESDIADHWLARKGRLRVLLLAGFRAQLAARYPGAICALGGNACYESTSGASGELHMHVDVLLQEEESLEPSGLVSVLPASKLVAAYVRSLGLRIEVGEAQSQSQGTPGSARKPRKRRRHGDSVGVAEGGSTGRRRTVTMVLSEYASDLSAALSASCTLEQALNMTADKPIPIPIVGVCTGRVVVPIVGTPATEAALCAVDVELVSAEMRDAVAFWPPCGGLGGVPGAFCCPCRCVAECTPPLDSQAVCAPLSLLDVDDPRLLFTNEPVLSLSLSGMGTGAFEPDAVGALAALDIGGDRLLRASHCESTVRLLTQELLSAARCTMASPQTGDGGARSTPNPGNPWMLDADRTAAAMHVLLRLLSAACVENLLSSAHLWKQLMDLDSASVDADSEHSRSSINPSSASAAVPVAVPTGADSVRFGVEYLRCAVLAMEVDCARLDRWSGALEVKAVGAERYWRKLVEDSLPVDFATTLSPWVGRYTVGAPKHKGLHAEVPVGFAEVQESLQSQGSDCTLLECAVCRLLRTNPNRTYSNGILQAGLEARRQRFIFHWLGFVLLNSSASPIEGLYRAVQECILLSARPLEDPHCLFLVAIGVASCAVEIYQELKPFQ